MIMEEEYVNKFLDMFRYVKYIMDEKVKIQHLLSVLPQSYRYWIEFVEPQTLDDVIREAKYCYD